MAKKQEKLSTPKILLIVLAASLLTNLYLLGKQGTAYEEPQTVKGMGKKYRQFLNTMPEKNAQEELVRWLQEDPLMIKAEIRNNQEFPGVWAEYCAGSKGALGNSWENLKNN